MKNTFRLVLSVAAVEVLLAVLLVPIGNPILIFGFIFGTAILALIGFLVFCMTSSNLAAIRALRDATYYQHQEHQTAMSAVMYLSERQAQTVEQVFQAGAYLAQLPSSGQYVAVLPGGKQTAINEDEAAYFQELEEEQPVLVKPRLRLPRGY